jgi:hypothetical protein
LCGKAVLTATEQISLKFLHLDLRTLIWSVWKSCFNGYPRDFSEVFTEYISGVMSAECCNNYNVLFHFVKLEYVLDISFKESSFCTNSVWKP